MEFLVDNGPVLLFYVFAVIAIAGALSVVLQRNPIYGAIGLLVTFLAVAALFLLRHAEFIALVQVFVYAGGIMVLFLFVIMLINLHRLHEVRMFAEGAPVGTIVGLLLIAVFAFVFWTVGFDAPFTNPDSLTMVEGQVMGNSEALAWELYRTYLLPFEIVSVFLLVAMIGAVILGRKA